MCPFPSVLCNFDIFLQIVRREGPSLWQELWPSIISLSNMGPIQVHCTRAHMIFIVYTYLKTVYLSVHMLGTLTRCDVMHIFFLIALMALFLPNIVGLISRKSMFHTVNQLCDGLFCQRRIEEFLRIAISLLN